MSDTNQMGSDAVKGVHDGDVDAEDVHVNVAALNTTTTNIDGNNTTPFMKTLPVVRATTPFTLPDGRIIDGKIHCNHLIPQLWYDRKYNNINDHGRTPRHLRLRRIHL